MLMKDTIDFPPAMLRTLISEYIRLHSDEMASAIMDGLYVEAVAMNSDRDNDGARVRLSLEIPSSDECRRLLDTGEIGSVRCPGI